MQPYEKKVEFKVNGVKQENFMKLGEGGEALFVFETTDNISKSLQTSPLVSLVSSPPLQPDQSSDGALQEPELLHLDGSTGKPRYLTLPRSGPAPMVAQSASSPNAPSPELSHRRPVLSDLCDRPHYGNDVLPTSERIYLSTEDSAQKMGRGAAPDASSHSSISPTSLRPDEAAHRAKNISEELQAVNIPTHVTDRGDLMLDMAGLKSSEEDAIKDEILARDIRGTGMQGNYDIGALYGMDEEGNLWFYSSEDAKEVVMKTVASLRPTATLPIDVASDPGHVNNDSATSAPEHPSNRRSESNAGLHCKNICSAKWRSGRSLRQSLHRLGPALREL